MQAFMEEPCFNRLRTRKQLGYYVDSSIRCMHGILGYSITVNSHSSKFRLFIIACQFSDVFRGYHMAVFISAHVSSPGVDNCPRLRLFLLLSTIHVRKLQCMGYVFGRSDLLSNRRPTTYVLFLRELFVASCRFWVSNCRSVQNSIGKLTWVYVRSYLQLRECR